MRLHFRTYGQGRPLVILHGLFGSLDNWHALSQRFGAHFHVFAVDQRNHGRSPHNQAMDYPLLADDLIEFVETVVLPTSQTLTQVDLLGHSMGGKAAMEFALRHPDRVEKLVVADIAPRAYPPLHEEILAALAALDLSAYAHRQQMEEALAPALPDLALRRFLLKSVVREPGGQFRWRLNLDGIRRNYGRLGEALAPGRVCPRPALFLRGGRSRYLQEADYPAVREFFPQALFRTVPGAGHWLHAEAPDLFCEQVLEFLGIPA